MKAIDNLNENEKTWASLFLRWVDFESGASEEEIVEGVIALAHFVVDENLFLEKIGKLPCANKYLLSAIYKIIDASAELHTLMEKDTETDTGISS